MAKFANNASGTVWSPNLQLIKVVPSGGDVGDDNFWNSWKIGQCLAGRHICPLLVSSSSFFSSHLMLNDPSICMHPRKISGKSTISLGDVAFLKCRYPAHKVAIEKNDFLAQTCNVSKTSNLRIISRTISDDEEVTSPGDQKHFAKYPVKILCKIS